MWWTGRAVGRWGVLAAASVLFTAGVVACGGNSSAVRLLITPSATLYDTPVTIAATGFKPGQTVQLRATSTDSEGVRWSSNATFTASTQGSVSTAQAATAGSYTGVNPMGLIETLSPAGTPTPEKLFTPSHDWKITVTAVIDGHTKATATATRQLALSGGAKETELRPATDQVYADLFLPADTSQRRPAVVAFGGAGGGMAFDVQAATLAAHGYPALALAYYKEPGLPSELSRIPLEYFVTAIKKLAAEPGVDPNHIFVWGLSRGGEAAQLLGADFPTLVHGVISTVGGADAGPALDNSNSPAWTLGGRPVPYNPDNLTGSPHTDPTPSSNISVEKIDGPILLVCGTEDETWPSCPWATAIANRLAAHHAAAPTVIRSVGAGHLVGNLLAYVPDTNTSFLVGQNRELAGGSPAADAAGRPVGWAALLAILARTGS